MVLYLHKPVCTSGFTILALTRDETFWEQQYNVRRYEASLKGGWGKAIKTIVDNVFLDRVISFLNYHASGNLCVNLF